MLWAAARRYGGLMVEVTALALSAGKAAASAVAKPLWQRVEDRAFGTVQQRRLERICAEALDAAVRDGAQPEAAEHSLSLLGAWFAGHTWPPLEGSTADQWARASILNLETAGIDVTAFPIDLEDLLMRVFVEVWRRMREDAAAPTSPLFNAMALDALSRLADQTAEGIPVEPGLRHRLETAVTNCWAAGIRFRTPHLLVALLDRDSVGRSSFNAARTGSGDDLAARLRAYTTRQWGETFEAVDIDQLPAVREARRIAQREGARTVTDPHVLLAVLDADPASATVGEIKHLMGAAYATAISRIRSAPRDQPSDRTPGPILDRP